MGSACKLTGGMILCADPKTSRMNYHYQQNALLERGAVTSFNTEEEHDAGH
jgi:hypothetical protein